MLKLGYEEHMEVEVNSIVSTINFFLRNRHIFLKSEQSVQQKIDGLKQKQNLMKAYEQELKDCVHSKHSQLKSQIDSTVNEGKNIANSVREFIDNSMNQSLLIFNQACVEGNDLAVYYINEQVLVRLK